MWIIIRNGKVIGTQAVQPAADAYGVDPIEGPASYMEWYGHEPRLAHYDPLTFTLVPADPIPAQTWESIRTVRTRLLQECDWTQVADSPLTPETKALWATYRQRLRDLTDIYSDPTLVIFPPKPEG